MEIFTEYKAVKKIMEIFTEYKAVKNYGDFYIV